MSTIQQMIDSFEINTSMIKSNMNQGISNSWFSTYDNNSTLGVRTHAVNGKGTGTIDWIEKLLDTPLDDFRKYIIKFILVPYLMNILGLSRSEAFDNISTWLNNCDSVCKLRFNIDRKINEALDMVRDYLPQNFHIHYLSS
jgi:hypothetical protein